MRTGEVNKREATNGDDMSLARAEFISHIVYHVESAVKGATDSGMGDRAVLSWRVDHHFKMAASAVRTRSKSVICS